MTVATCSLVAARKNTACTKNPAYVFEIRINPRFQNNWALIIISLFLFFYKYWRFLKGSSGAVSPLV